jgi:hypothetical protein
MNSSNAGAAMKRQRKASATSRIVKKQATLASANTNAARVAADTRTVHANSKLRPSRNARRNERARPMRNAQAATCLNRFARRMRLTDTPSLPSDVASRSSRGTSPSAFIPISPGSAATARTSPGASACPAGVSRTRRRQHRTMIRGKRIQPKIFAQPTSALFRRLTSLRPYCAASAFCLASGMGLRAPFRRLACSARTR